MDFTQNILFLSSILCSRQLCLELAHLLFPVVTPIQLDSTFNHVFFSLVKRSKLTHNKLWSHVLLVQYLGANCTRSGPCVNTT